MPRAPAMRIVSIFRFDLSMRCLLQLATYLIVTLNLFSLVDTRTQNDDKKLYEAGQPKLIQGILKGDFALFKDGNCVLS